MAELATIARPYAEALARASGADMNATSAWLDELAVVAADPQVKAVAQSPTFSTQQVADLIASVMKAPLGAQGNNFLNEVLANGRLAALPEMAAQFRTLKNVAGGVSDATVYSAFSIDAQTLSSLAGVLEKRFGRKLNLEVAIDPDLIGGVRVVVGDEVLDTSVKARLEQMKSALMA